MHAVEPLPRHAPQRIVVLPPQVAQATTPFAPQLAQASQWAGMMRISPPCLPSLPVPHTFLRGTQRRPNPSHFEQAIDPVPPQSVQVRSPFPLHRTQGTLPLLPHCVQNRPELRHLGQLKRRVPSQSGHASAFALPPRRATKANGAMAPVATLADLMMNSLRRMGQLLFHTQETQEILFALSTHEPTRPPRGGQLLTLRLFETGIVLDR
jgi:hypothetical protein